MNQKKFISLLSLVIFTVCINVSIFSHAYTISPKVYAGPYEVFMIVEEYGAVFFPLHTQSKKEHFFKNINRGYYLGTVEFGSFADEAFADEALTDEALTEVFNGGGSFPLDSKFFFHSQQEEELFFYQVRYIAFKFSALKGQLIPVPLFSTNSYYVSPDWMGEMDTRDEDGGMTLEFEATGEGPKGEYTIEGTIKDSKIVNIRYKYESIRESLVGGHTKTLCTDILFSSSPYP